MTPRVSLLLASRDANSSLARALSSLAALDGIAACEVVVAVYPDPGEEARSIFPEFIFIVPPLPMNTAELRGLAMAEASGDWIFLTEPFCEYPHDLLKKIEEAARSGADVIGGAVEVAEGVGLAGWASAFFEYGQFFPPLPESQVEEITCNNVLYRRAILEPVAEWARGGFWKFFAHERFAREGRRFTVQPSRRVIHRPPYRFLEFAARSFHHGRTFGVKRGTERSGLGKLALAARAPLVPAALGWRLLRRCWPKRAYRARLVSCLPIIACYHAAWALGEGIGAVAGPGASEPKVY